MHGSPEVTPHQRPEDILGIFDDAEAIDDDTEALVSWELMQIVQQGRADDASPQEVRMAEKAFTAIYERNYNSVFYGILRRINNRSVAEELASETFLRAFKNAEKFTWQEKDISSWLHTIAVHIVFDYVKRPERKAYITPMYEGDDYADGSSYGQPEGMVLSQVRREEVMRAINQLKPEYRDIIIAHYYEEKPIAAIAAETGANPSAVKSLAWRAVQALKQAVRTDSSEHQAEPVRPMENWSVLISQEEPSDDEATEETLEAENKLGTKSSWVAPTALPYANYSESEALNHPFLSAAELESLAAQIALGKEAQAQLDDAGLDPDERRWQQEIVQHGNVARHDLAVHYLRFALSIALRYRNSPNFDDIVQVANLGLMKAADRYDPYYQLDDETTYEKIVPFTTAGFYHINGGILDYLRSERRHRRASTHALSSDGPRLLRRVHEEALRLGHDVTLEDVGEWLDYPRETTKDLLLGKITVRTAVVMGMEMTDINPADPTSDQEFERVEYNLHASKFWDFITKHVTEKELAVLRSYYVEGNSQEVIASNMGFTHRSSVGQILDQAHVRIRKAMNGEDPFERRRRGTSKRKDGPRTFFTKLGVPPAEDADPQEMRERLARLFDSLNLTPKEASIMQLRYGLSDPEGKEMSQIETAKKLGLSRGFISEVDPDIQRRARAYLGLESQKDTEK